MKKQDYANHKKYYPPHHFIFLPLMVFFIGLGIRNAFAGEQHRLEWTLFSLLAFCIFYLAVMLRQHYALGNQNRIVRLEFRLRYYELFAESSKNIEEKLSFGQIAALRFAGDSEFKLLLDQVLKENLTADQIKKSIKHWEADNMRI